MYCEELNTYKSKIIATLRNSNDIRNILIPKHVREKFTEDCEYEEELKKHLFKFLYVPDVQTDMSVYIGVDVISNNPDFSLKDLTIIIDIWSHKMIMDYDNDWTRPDKICDIIQKLFDGSRDYGGVGKLKLERVGLLQSEKKFYGKEMKFKVDDFNNPHKKVGE